jgi:hypothetical protein
MRETGTGTINVLNGNHPDSVAAPSVDDAGHEDWDSLPIPIIFRSSLFRHGEERAVNSMALKANDADLAALDEHADAMAEEAARNTFDAENNLADKLHLEEYNQNISRRDDLRQKSSEAGRQFHARNQELATLGNLDHEPRAVSLVTKFILASLVAATVILTLHDFVFSFDDEIANWFVSASASLILGIGVVWIETQNFD